MKIWNWLLENSKQLFRGTWWVASFSIASYLIIARFNEIIIKEPVPFDIGLISFISVLILLPFVSEVSIFGFTVKKQIEQVKQEIKQNIKDETQAIRNEILAIGISNKLTSNLVIQNTPNPPPDSELIAIRNQISEVVKQFQTERGIHNLPEFDENVSAETIYAFTQRYLIEKEIKRIWTNRISSNTVTMDSVYRPPSFSRMIQDLARFELTTPNLSSSLREVFAVASSAIHGNEPSKEKIYFLREVCPEILATLKSIK